ncbi:MAG: hypothetical protein M1838_004521 [Thelocarpon superellum]|nr:MAG: hypothetical protein M1838_004521 [Thelocarpon superellum]
MPSTEEDSPSDNDNERPVREKLKNASLGVLNQSGKMRSTASGSEGGVDDVLEQAQTSVARSSSHTSHKKGDERENGAATGGPAVERKIEGKDGAVVPSSTTLTTKGGMEGILELSDRPAAGDEDASADRPQTPIASIPAQENDAENVPTSSSPTIGDTPVSPSATADASMEDAKERLASPKKKRSRDQFDKDHAREDEPAKDESTEEQRGSEEPDRVTTTTNRTSRIFRDQPEKKRYRDASQEAVSKESKEPAKVPPTSGFANTSAISPFATLGSPKSGNTVGTSSEANESKEASEQSSSAFAASGFAALAGSNASPFGTLGASNPTASGFAGLAAKKSPSSSTFGGALGGTPLVFGSNTTSGFGKLGEGLGGGLTGGFGGSKGGLTSFTSKTGTGIIGLSDHPSKAFGAPEGDDEDDDDEDDEGDGDADGNGEDGEKARQASEDRRFQQQEVETGEEDEETVFSGHAKLYHLMRGDNAAEHGWKERGAGVLKVNASRPPPPSSHEDEGNEGNEGGNGQEEEQDEEEDEGVDTTMKTSARLLMRASGVYRVILNAPIYKNMKLLSPEGAVPTSTKSSRSIMLTILEGGKPTMMQLKVI